MVAITVRSLPEPVHEALGAMAARHGVSVEGLARRLLAAGSRGDVRDGDMGVTGMAEVSLPWGPAPEAVVAQSPMELWGALRGSVFVPAGMDLTAPLDETWEAA